MAHIYGYTQFAEFKPSGGTKALLDGEKNSTLTISEGFIDGQGASGCVVKNAQLKSWSLKIQQMMSLTDFITLFNIIRSRKTATFYFSGTTINLYGEGIIKKLSFAGQGVGVVLVNIDVQGAGKPTIS